ncbi:oxygenase MpaB family protein [Phenylobacterium aquaticum]|uniref:oxygenase MpaB family protein n=1 Tax=Phenylobacterium aquaticum TaxID=1763816 RepID=UPI001F5DE581|nr:oxygenase MpaB family protein [Phenylobacterium aquaticum]MCI3134170.1 oxygenase MpaB family protein [Phenylobacterium aquaticum]
MTTPVPLISRLADRAARALFAAPGLPEADYLSPMGDPGLYGPDSVAWRAHANPVTLAVGGIAAVILELAEPRVRTGVWEHSIFRTQPLLRLKRTGEAAMVTTYGPTEAAERRIAMVARMHARVGGTTPEGQAYQALDPELMTWVHVTAGYGFLNAHLRYVEPDMSRADQDRYYAEGRKVGEAFGARDIPGSVGEVADYMAAMTSRLRRHPILGEFLGLVGQASPLGRTGRPLQGALVQAAIDLTPAEIAARLGVTPGRGATTALVRVLAKAALAATGADSIPGQAYRRMGRPARSFALRPV